MIIDRLENASRYYALGSGISEALNYLQKNNPESFHPGSYEIIKEKVRMLVFESEQTNTDRIKMEAHRKYIDVQYWVSGSELMGHAFLQSQSLIEPFNEEKDYGN